MTFPVVVVPSGDQFTASLVGVPDLRVVGVTRAAALDAIRTEIASRISRGELFSVEVDLLGVSDLAGKYAGDPTLAEIAADAYRRRNAERAP